MGWRWFGSSPHTWGIRFPFCKHGGRNWFIPTYVGYTFRRELMTSCVTVHPHIRGVYTKWRGRSTATWRFIPTYVGYTAFDGINHELQAGSSPHTWGILFCFSSVAVVCRFIPTYVGYTPLALCNVQSPPVHPHIRGVYYTNSCTNSAQTGSSPHTWGIRSNPQGRDRPRRFIPTYVGYTLDRRKKNGWFQPLLL